jgi:hypothetical protein
MNALVNVNDHGGSSASSSATATQVDCGCLILDSDEDGSAYPFLVDKGHLLPYELDAPRVALELVTVQKALDAIAEAHCRIDFYILQLHCQEGLQQLDELLARDRNTSPDEFVAQLVCKQAVPNLRAPRVGRDGGNYYESTEYVGSDDQLDDYMFAWGWIEKHAVFKATHHLFENSAYTTPLGSISRHWRLINVSQDGV